MSSIFERELQFERRVAESTSLSIFRRNATTWELLLLLAAQRGSGSGVHNVISALQTSYMGQSALLKFLRQRREDGTIEFVDHEAKRSMRRLTLSQALYDSIEQELHLRDTARERDLRKWAWR